MCFIAHSYSFWKGDNLGIIIEMKINLVTSLHLLKALIFFIADGRKTGPVLHGKTTPDTLLEVNVVSLFLGLLYIFVLKWSCAYTVIYLDRDE
jgi:hypothetical protein